MTGREGPFPNPTVSGIWPLGGFSAPRPGCSLGAGGESVLMDGADDIGHSGLNEDLWGEKEASVH